jgi:hypothetical protein
MSEENKTPEVIAAEAEAATAAAAAAADTSAPEELKPLSDTEMETMTTEQITEHATKFEAQNKAAKTAAKTQTPEEIRANQVQRLKNAQETGTPVTTAPAEVETAPAAKLKEVTTADVLTMAKNSLELGSPEQVLLQKRIEQGVIKNYAEGIETHVGVMAEISQIVAKNNAESVIDENADAETQLQTKKEIVAQSRVSGEVPEDKDSREAVVEDNLSRMPSLN